MALRPQREVPGPERFVQAVAELPVLLEQLRKAPPHGQSNRLEIPQVTGVYLFSDGDRPIYVGQARKLRRRYDQHTKPESRHFQASFAFLRARKKAELVQGFDLEQKRAALEADPVFKLLFAEAKAEVASMAFRFLAVPSPIVRTIFEVYAALHLGTEEFNSFETH